MRYVVEQWTGTADLSRKAFRTVLLGCRNNDQSGIALYECLRFDFEVIVFYINIQYLHGGLDQIAEEPVEASIEFEGLPLTREVLAGE